MKPSKGEAEYATQLRAYRFKEPVREYRFARPLRQWRFDFAWPDERIAVEIEGVSRGGDSRHQRVAGYAEDCRKYNTALALGWVVYRFTQRQVSSGEAIEFTAMALENPAVDLRTDAARTVTAWFERRVELGDFP